MLKKETILVCFSLAISNCAVQKNNHSEARNNSSDARLTAPIVCESEVVSRSGSASTYARCKQGEKEESGYICNSAKPTQMEFIANLADGKKKNFIVSSGLTHGLLEYSSAYDLKSYPAIKKKLDELKLTNVSWIDGLSFGMHSVTLYSNEGVHWDHECTLFKPEDIKATLGTQDMSDTDLTAALKTAGYADSEAPSDVKELYLAAREILKTHPDFDKIHFHKTAATKGAPVPFEPDFDNAPKVSFSVIAGYGSFGANAVADIYVRSRFNKISTKLGGRVIMSNASGDDSKESLLQQINAAVKNTSFPK